MATCGDRVLQEYAAEMCRPVAMASNRMSLTQWHTRESSNQKPLVHALARQWLRCTRGHLLTTCSAVGTVAGEWASTARARYFRASRSDNATTLL